MGLPPFIIIVVPVVNVFVIQHGTNVTQQTEHVPNTVLPDVSNLTLVSTDKTSFTVSWERPKDHFDYYLVEVTGSSHEDGDVGPYRVGSCANGSIVDAHQEQVTCDHIEPCTNVSFRIRTHAKGPPQRTSLGGHTGWHLCSRARPRFSEKCVDILVNAIAEPIKLETT
ncbi:hypothetical protein MRX96_055398 [Rhipicephalus microplus]